MGIEKMLLLPSPPESATTLKGQQVTRLPPQTILQLNDNVLVSKSVLASHARTYVQRSTNAFGSREGNKKVREFKGIVSFIERFRLSLKGDVRQNEQQNR